MSNEELLLRPMIVSQEELDNSLRILEKRTESSGKAIDKAIKYSLEHKRNKAIANQSFLEKILTKYFPSSSKTARSSDHKRAAV